MNGQTDELVLARKALARDIAGEIVLSESPEQVIKKWREIFKISQKELANRLGITSSVVSDYESGRRRSPGIRVINKYVGALLDIDLERGGKIVRSFSKNTRPHKTSSAIIDIREFDSGKSIAGFCNRINATLLSNDSNKNIYGYTIIDSFKAVTEFSFRELVQVYGTTSQRALVFTKVETGRTPLVAIKVAGLHPTLVVLHGLDVVDDVAKRIAEAEGISLAICRLDSVDKIVERLGAF